MKTGKRHIQLTVNLTAEIADGQAGATGYPSDEDIAQFAQEVSRRLCGWAGSKSRDFSQCGIYVKCAPDDVSWEDTSGTQELSTRFSETSSEKPNA